MASTRTNPDDRFVERIEELERRIRNQERQYLTNASISGGDGTRKRWEVGYDATTGKFGVRVWDAAGVLQINDMF